MENNKVYGMLGLAAKSGSVVSGGNSCEIYLKKRNIPPLLIIASDASENTKEKFLSLAIKKGILYKIFGKSEELGKYTGKDNRSVLIITNNGFAESITATLDSLVRKNGGGHIGKNQGL